MGFDIFSYYRKLFLVVAGFFFFCLFPSFPLLLLSSPLNLTFFGGTNVSLGLDLGFGSFVFVDGEFEFEED